MEAKREVSDLSKQIQKFPSLICIRFTSFPHFFGTYSPLSLSRSVLNCKKSGLTEHAQLALRSARTCANAAIQRGGPSVFLSVGRVYPPVCPSLGVRPFVSAPITLFSLSGHFLRRGNDCVSFYNPKSLS